MQMLMSISSKIPVQRLGQVSEGSGAEIRSGVGRLRCRGIQERFRKVPEGSGVKVRSGVGRFRCRGLVRFRKFQVQRSGQFPEGCGADAKVQVPEGPVQISSPEDPKYGLFACIWVCTLSERPTMLFAV